MKCSVCAVEHARRMQQADELCALMAAPFISQGRPITHEQRARERQLFASLGGRGVLVGGAPRWIEYPRMLLYA